MISSCAGVTFCGEHLSSALLAELWDTSQDLVWLALVSTRSCESIPELNKQSKELKSSFCAGETLYKTSFQAVQLPPCFELV